MSDLAFRSIRELGVLLRRREVSCVELAEHFLDRLERMGGGYGAVVTVTRERALAEAARADRELRQGKPRGPLHGIPYGAKDLLAAAGAPTTWGAQPFRDQLLATDATVVARLERAGAVLCAKLAMVELAGGMGYNQAFASFTGPGRTPWAPAGDRWSGGSSSGSGAAVGAGLVPFAIGSETWGSIQFPSAFCGVTGVRPTYGRVSRHGAMALSWSMDKLGPMGRTAEDCGLVLAAIAGADPDDPTTLHAPFGWPAPARQGWRPRLGILADARERHQPEVLANFERALEVLREDCDVVEGVTLPDFPYDAMAALIIDVEGASAFEPLFESGRITELTAPEDRIGGYAGLVIPARDYLRALRLRRPAGMALDGLLRQFDALVAPTLPTVAWPLDTPFDKVYPDFPGGRSVAGPANLCGVPAIFLPNGTGEGGLPTSLQFTARAGAEATLLELGRRFQARTGFHRLRPPGL